MRIHALEATGGLTYAPIWPLPVGEHPSDAAGTNDTEAAAKDERKPDLEPAAEHLDHRDGARELTQVSCMAEQISIFAIVVGIALLLTGVAVVSLAFAVFGRPGPPPPAPAA